jgi:hypothetical protein
VSEKYRLRLLLGALDALQIATPSSGRFLHGRRNQSDRLEGRIPRLSGCHMHGSKGGCTCWGVGSIEYLPAFAAILTQCPHNFLCLLLSRGKLPIGDKVVRIPLSSLDRLAAAEIRHEVPDAAANSRSKQACFSLAHSTAAASHKKHHWGRMGRRQPILLFHGKSLRRSTWNPLNKMVSHRILRSCGN